ncbi:MAG: hypothetical protein PHG25_02105 [Candidatus Pacebacteria bacterium]|nr:hypothetical protein [Candidatus Paceibacterota bacterium]
MTTLALGGTKATAAITYTNITSVPWISFGPLLSVSNGVFYGTSNRGGTNAPRGSIFSVSESGQMDTLYAFSSSTATNANSPMGPLLMIGTDLYGSANGLIFNRGHLFKYNVLADTYTNILRFDGTNNGDGPMGGVITIPGSGIVYYTTPSGGSSGNYGVVGAVSTNGSLLWVTPFANTNGASPWAGLTYNPNDGYLYGLTESGGKYDAGAFFRVNPTNHSITALHSFTNTTDGGNPQQALVLGPDNIFRSTWSSGAGGVFQIKPTGEYKVLYTFPGTDYTFPQGLTPGPNGDYFGVTWFGGSANGGQVFRITTNGDFSVLIDLIPTGSAVFKANTLTFGTNGNLFGTAVVQTNIFQVSVPLVPFIQKIEGLNTNTLRVTINSAAGQSYVLKAYSGDLSMTPLIVSNTAVGGTDTFDITGITNGYGFYQTGVFTNGLPTSYHTNMTKGIYPPPITYSNLAQLPMLPALGGGTNGSGGGGPPLP